MTPEHTGPHESTTPTAGAGVPRRTIVQAALAASAGLASWSLTALPASASTSENGLTDAGVGVAPGPRQALRAVSAADGTSVLMPVELGAVLRAPSRPLRQGATIVLTWDSRLYTVSPQVKFLAGTRTAFERPIRPAANVQTHRSTLSVPIPEALEPGQEYILSAGALTQARYPDDLVTDPHPVTISLMEPGSLASPRTTVLSRSGGRTSPPWGVELGAAWLTANWGEHFTAPRPGLVTLHSVGPGALPVSSRVHVSLDPQVFSSVHLSAGLDSAGRAVVGHPSTSRRAGRLTATWTTTRTVPAGDRISIEVHAQLRRPTRPLTWVEPPLISFSGAARRREAQRFTGLESLTREDGAIYSPAMLRALSKD